MSLFYIYIRIYCHVGSLCNFIHHLHHSFFLPTWDWGFVLWWFARVGYLQTAAPSPGSSSFWCPWMAGSWFPVCWLPASLTLRCGGSWCTQLFLWVWVIRIWIRGFPASLETLTLNRPAMVQVEHSWGRHLQGLRKFYWLLPLEGAGAAWCRNCLRRCCSPCRTCVYLVFVADMETGLLLGAIPSCCRWSDLSSSSE